MDELSFSDDLAGAVARRLEAMAEERLVGRLWARDHTLWKPEPTEIDDRLGWLEVAWEMVGRVAELRDFASGVAADGFNAAVLCGMGGSSLAPEVLKATWGVAPGALDLHVLDTTDPDEIAGLEARLDLGRTLFIIASKSGGTIETASHYAYFRAKAAASQFVAITDPGTRLEKLARDDGFRRVFLNPPEIGGRYSALSLFGLVPAALIGADIEAILDSAIRMANRCGPEAPIRANPGAVLGAAMGEATLAGRDKLTLMFERGGALGPWVEQLVAESTGKEGRGIVPVTGEAPLPPDVYGRDRLFVCAGDPPAAQGLTAAGHPVLRLPLPSPAGLGSEFFRWEFATAVAGSILGINPFDQPNVQEAKDRTAALLAGGALPDTITPTGPDVLASLRPGDYLAIIAFLPRDAAHSARLEAARAALGARYRVATTLGFGPRYLHSTGQLHKGGANNGVFLQVVGESPRDLPIPGQPFTFRGLQRAQAAGDLESLLAHGRRVARVSLRELEALAT